MLDECGARVAAQRVLKDARKNRRPIRNMLAIFLRERIAPDREQNTIRTPCCTNEKEWILHCHGSATERRYQENSSKLGKVG